MKKNVYRADRRGFSNHGWLKTYHTFSFANYYNESRMNFGKLRVFNDNSVEPGGRFGPHSHDNMEMIYIPLEGSIAHKDLTGNDQISSKGDVQIISAGKGLTHTEYNPSDSLKLNFLEIWIYPEELNTEPAYKRKQFEFKKDILIPLISPDGFNSSLDIYQHASIYYGNLTSHKKLTYQRSDSKNGILIFIISGKLGVIAEELHSRDTMAVMEQDLFDLLPLENTELLLIDIII